MSAGPTPLTPASATDGGLTHDTAWSSDGTRLAYVTAGDPKHPAIILIHGWSQQMSCWTPTFERLSDSHYLVAFDLRGHGGSGMPPEAEAYTDTALWGDDVKAVIEASGARHPVLVGWSYGSRVIAAYLATHGDVAISGVALVGCILALGAAREDWMIGGASPARDRDLYTDDATRRLAATLRFVEACTATPQSRRAFAEAVGANMLCPAHVRQALFAADVDFQPVYAAMDCPGLVIHGTDDIVVTPATGRVAADLMRHGRFLPYEGVGHVPFAEAPDRFADDLAEFVAACRKDPGHD